jgi:hypothetical protein
MMIEARVDGQKGYLVFDTGASGLVLNKTYFRDHIATTSADSKGITGSVDAETITADSVEFAGMMYTHLSAGRANLGHIENRRGVKVLGLFGFSLFRSFEVIIDTQKSQIYLFKTDASGNRLAKQRSEFIADYNQKIEVQNNVLFLKGNIGGKSLKFCFDTGAETNVIDKNSSKAVLNTVTITRRTNLRGVGNESNEVLFGNMTEFKLDKTLISNMETVLMSLENLSEAYGTHIDGMLGYDFISKGVFCINFAKKQLAISFHKEEQI